MAYIGLAKPTIAKLDESEGSAKYTNAFTCGKAIEVSISPQYAEGSLYGDDSKAEYDKEFTYADVTMNTTTLPIEAHSVMFGHEVAEDNKTIKDKDSDEANYVGFGVYVPEKVDNKKKYIGMWIYKVKFTEGEESYKTKGDAIEYQTPSVSGQAVALDSGEWRERKIFDTEAEVKKWLTDMSAKTNADPTV